MATSTALAAKRVQYPLEVVTQLSVIEQDLGGRAEIVGMLTLAPLTPDLRYLLGLLGDPRNQGKALATICAQGNVLPGELLKHLGQAALLRGKVRASQKIGDGIAAVAEDVMKRAAPYEAACYACGGMGTLPPADPTPAHPNPSPEPCETCRTTGRLTYQPDLDRQKLAIEMAQLLPKSGGLQILNQQIAGGAGGINSGGGALEQLQQLTDQLLYGQGPAAPVEGEVVDPDPPEAP